MIKWSKFDEQFSILITNESLVIIKRLRLLFVDMPKKEKS